MRSRRATQQRIDGLYCLLAEQVYPHERLLWRGCPDSEGSSAARVHRYRYGSILSVAGYRVLGLSAALATLAFFSTRGSGPPTEDTTISAGLAAFFMFYLTLFACVVAYFLVQLARAGDIRWPTWHRRYIRGLLRVPVPRWQKAADPLIEPSAAFIPTDRVIYGLTDQRVIVLVDGPRRSIRSYWLHEITGVKCIDARDGWGDLALIVNESELACEETDGEEADPPCDTEWEEVRLGGVARASCVAEALRCLLARCPLQDALAALAGAGGALGESGGSAWGKGAPRTIPLRARMWQATFWHGSSQAQIVPCTLYGSSLNELRRRARERLVALHPPCFSNGPLPASQDACHTPSSQLALYLSSESSDPAAGPGPDSPGAQATASGPPSIRSAKKRRGTGAQDAQGARSRAGQGSPPQNTSTTAGEAPPPSLSTKPSRRDTVWWRKARRSDPTAPLEFGSFGEAVAHFVTRDLLPERGPAYEDVLLARGSRWQDVQTIRVVDDEALANELLRRGGWHVMTTMGMTAPRGASGPVLFVLGHPESGAV